MSLTRPTADLAKNPAERFIEAKSGGNQGFFQYYVKPANEGEKGENKKEDFKTKGFFILESDLFCISGYNDDDPANAYSIQSNEVRQKDVDGNILDPYLIVKAYPLNKKNKPYVIAEGHYSAIKDKVCNKIINAHFTKCLYLMNAEGLLVHLKLSGAGFASYLKDVEKHPAKYREYWVKASSWEDKKRGSVDYKMPIFEFGDKVTKEEYDRAVKLDRITQEYLDVKLKSSPKAEKADLHYDNEPEQQENRPINSTAFDTKNWRAFQESGRPPLGSLSIQEINRLQISLESSGDVDSDLYNCCCQALYDYNKILKDESWKEKKNAKGFLSEATVEDLKETLAKINLNQPSHAGKIFVEAALEVKVAEQGPSKEVEVEVVDEDEDIPF